jgi:hypothetical protein
MDDSMSPQGRFLNEGRVLDFILEDKAKSGPESRVASLCLPKSLAKRVNPSTYHPTLQALNPGGLVNCKVEAVARNGLRVSFAVFRGAIHVNHLGANWIPANKQGSDAEWKAVFADVRNVAARIIAVDARTKVIRLSLQPHVVTLTEPPQLPSVGTIVENATVHLFNKVTTFAEGNPLMAHELTIGLQTLLSKFIERKNSGETANTSEHEFASLPQLDKSKTNKRLKPVLNPDKRYRGKTKLHE